MRYFDALELREKGVELVLLLHLQLPGEPLLFQSFFCECL
jgi:hypothetical protein